MHIWASVLAYAGLRVFLMACAMHLYIQLHTFSITSSVITRQEITKSVPVTGLIISNCDSHVEAKGGPGEGACPAVKYVFKNAGGSNSIDWHVSFSIFHFLHHHFKALKL